MEYTDAYRLLSKGKLESSSQESSDDESESDLDDASDLVNVFCVSIVDSRRSLQIEKALAEHNIDSGVKSQLFSPQTVL
jgi:hypothetical protein